MTNSEIKEVANVISINPDSSNIIFLDERAISKHDAARLSDILGKLQPDFGCIAMVKGNPNEIVKLISDKEVESIDEHA